MQAKTYNTQKLLRNSILLFASLCMLHSASSATFTTGGGKKNDGKKTTITSLNLKSSPLSFSNGYRFRSGLTFSGNSNANNLVIQGNTIRFQKGNNLYVLPVKQKLVFSKFKTPQKEVK